MIEKDFDVSLIAGLALKEKQIQQNYRPIIAVHKWFARRPGTLFRGLLLSEFADREGPLKDIFYKANNIPDIRIADPFMGGGTTLIEANRIGADVVGSDINPMSYWIVREELEPLDLERYAQSVESLRSVLERHLGGLYRTRCLLCGDDNAHVKYFLWVKIIPCRRCGGDIELFPGYLLASNVRHPKNVVICRSCGSLIEVEDRHALGDCPCCGSRMSLLGPARHGRCLCPSCGEEEPYPGPTKAPPRHRLIALEYYCPLCKKRHAGRFFKRPDADDLERVRAAEEMWAKVSPRFVPEDDIPSGDETDRLLRWGYRKYRDMFNVRQLLGLELSARTIARVEEDRLRNALATNFSDLLRYQNMLCRYDSTALKSLDIFSVHGYPVGLIQCESNLLGVWDHDKGAAVGSGGWKNIAEKFKRAKAYCQSPFEFKHDGKRKVLVPIDGEWIGDVCDSGMGRTRKIELHCADSAALDLSPSSIDAVFTDPPYLGNVQYAELMDFCYVWLRLLLKDRERCFERSSTRDRKELTMNFNMGRDLEAFSLGLSAVFQKIARALKKNAPFVFTYHHNRLEAYVPVAVAILDAGLSCSMSLPCPAEMAASIHINGTGSSIIDTVFVCRSAPDLPRDARPRVTENVASLVREDLAKLREGGVKTTLGDIRCIIFGHFVRLTIEGLHDGWDKEAEMSEKMAMVSERLRALGSWEDMEKLVSDRDRDEKEPLR